MLHSPHATSAGGHGLMVSLRLHRRRVLVVGGNKEAASRVRHALAAGACVSVLARKDSLCEDLLARLARSEFTFLDAEFSGIDDLTIRSTQALSPVATTSDDNGVSSAEPKHSSHTEDAYDYVLACLETNDPRSRAIAECARALRIPVNCADVPELCDFFFVATVTEGRVQVGVSTNGGGPRLAARLRTLIAEALPKRTQEAVANIAALRERIKQLPIEVTVKTRMSWMSNLCDQWSFDDMADIDEKDSDRLVDAFKNGEPVPKPSHSKLLYRILQSPAGSLQAVLSFLFAFTYQFVYRALTPTTAQTNHNSSMIAKVDESSKRAENANITIPSLSTNLKIESPTIALVGAGPGNPTMLTIAALQHLFSADTIISDVLVSPEILDLLPHNANIKFVPKKEKGQSDSAQDAANDMCLDAIASGAKHVVRLKGGDPFVFGRGGEELVHFRARGVRVLVVPGVSSANGVLASANIPATFKGVSDSVLVLTARGERGAWPDVPEFVAGTTMRTTVVFMPIARMKGLSDLMIEKGYPLEMPAAVIERGSCKDQRVLKATLSSIASVVASSDVQSPALLVVGDVCTVLEN
ncbi:hypothetical protein HDU83_005263 [Entophlyctis luteolus]|nr:hypothetical protein HDU83_005263 [Entophlyctis luteolus]